MISWKVILPAVFGGCLLGWFFVPDPVALWEKSSMSKESAKQSTATESHQVQNSSEEDVNLSNAKGRFFRANKKMLTRVFTDPKYKDVAAEFSNKNQQAAQEFSMDAKYGSAWLSDSQINEWIALKKKLFFSSEYACAKMIKSRLMPGDVVVAFDESLTDAEAEKWMEFTFESLRMLKLHSKEYKELKKKNTQSNFTANLEAVFKTMPSRDMEIATKVFDDLSAASDADACRSMKLVWEYADKLPEKKRVEFYREFSSFN